MRQILVVHPGEGTEDRTLSFGGEPVAVRRAGYGGDLGRACALVAEHGGGGQFTAVALEGLPLRLRLGSVEVFHEHGRALLRSANSTPLVDGAGVRGLLERWAVARAERQHPGIFGGKRVLMVPGLNHNGLATSLGQFARELRYADPTLFFGFPRLPGVGSVWSLDSVAQATLSLLSKAPPERLRPRPGLHGGRRERALFRWAQVLAGDLEAIRSLAPEYLRGRTVVIETATREDLDRLRDAGVRAAVLLLPEGYTAPVVEAALVACRQEPHRPPSEDAYLDRLAELNWRPVVLQLQPEEAEVNRFAFVIHPLSVDFIRRHPRYRWTRFLPERVVERIAAHMRPTYVSRITGARSEATGQRVEGHLITLGATPRQMMRRSPRFTYRKLNQAARMAENLGARLIGLGAFTSVVGDAGITVARESPIPVTSGNSLTVAATLEAAKVAARRMGVEDLSRGRAMVIGATGSIGSVCARMIALAVRDVVLVSIEPEKLIELKRQIREELPGARVTVATRSRGLVGQCDVIVTATSGFGQRILDISECKPGAIVCDVARPPDISKAEAALRPDVLVIESGEVLIPGKIDFGYDIGLPPGVSYACLAETTLLAMDNRFESYTLGRRIDIDKVKEIYRLFKHHGFRLAGLRSLGRYLTDDDLAEKRALADRLRADTALFRHAQESAAEGLARIPRMSKGVRASGGLFRAAG